MLLLLLEMQRSSSNRINRIRGRIVYPFAATQQQRGRGFKGDFQGYPYPKTANQNGGGIGGILYKGGQFLLPYAKRAAVAGVKAAIPVAGGATLNLSKGKGKKKTVALAKKKLKAKAKKIGVQTTANALQDIVLSAKPKPKKMTAKPKSERREGVLHVGGHPRGPQRPHEAGRREKEDIQRQFGGRHV